MDGPSSLPNHKPMVELTAGSNVWYQAYVLKESLNEAKVRFPGEMDGAQHPAASWWWVGR